MDNKLLHLTFDNIEFKIYKIIYLYKIRARKPMPEQVIRNISIGTQSESNDKTELMPKRLTPV